MPAIIRTTLHNPPNGPIVGPILTSQSRDDLRKGFEVVLESVDTHTTYAWTLAFTPESPNRTDSAATLLPPENSTSKTARFIADHEGSYLVRLIVDLGLPTENTQFVRIRSKTRFGNLNLVAAGERRDETGIIPVDATPEGWANDQNQNLQVLAAFIRRQASTGRVLWVDSNRGRDNAGNQNDPLNTFVLPGSDLSDNADDIQISAEGHGDFFSINDAISFALDAISRGEPAPSSSDPYFILVKPGLYLEDLNLQPWIHVFGESNTKFGIFESGESAGVVVRTVNAGGATHEYSPLISSDTCILSGISLENTADVTSPVLSHTNGVLRIHSCSVHQKGNGVSQGPAVRISDAANSPIFQAYDSLFLSDAVADDERVSFLIDAPDVVVTVYDSEIVGRTGLEYNRNLLTSPGSVTLERCLVAGGDGYGIRHYGEMSLLHSSLIANDPNKSLFVEGFGQPPGAMLGQIILDVSYSSIGGRITFDTTTAGAVLCDLKLNTVEFSDLSNYLNFPGTVPSTFESLVHGRSVAHVSNYTNPVTGSLSVPVTSQLNVNNVQDAIDLLTNITLPLGISPFWSLESAYNGLASVNPFVLGAGLGRTLLADDGSVQITGALAPLTNGDLFDADLNGGLQIEGSISVGPLTADGRGSELSLFPNPFGFGPEIRLGRNIWPSGFSGSHRGFPSALILAGVNSSTFPGQSSPFNLRMRTPDDNNSSTGEIGRVILEAGSLTEDVTSTDDAGSLYFRAGDNADISGTGLAGSIFLSPGRNDNAGNDGRVEFANPDTATGSVLDAAGLFVGGIDGTLVLATEDGSIFQYIIGAGDNLATVISTINTNSTGKLIASDNAGALRITTLSTGPNAEIGVVGDFVPLGNPGDLLVALGELRVGSGATFSPGSYVDTVGLSCISDGVIKVHGTIVSLGGSGGYINTDINYVMSLGDRIVGVDTLAAAGNVTVTLPPSPDNGYEVIIKDEENNASVNNILLQTSDASTIEGGVPPFVISTDFASSSLYYANNEWFVY